MVVYSSSFTSSVVILHPDKEVVVTVLDFRLITLINLLFKIKILWC